VGVFGKSRVNKIDGGPMTISIAAQITIIIMIHVHNQKVSARRAPTGQQSPGVKANPLHTDTLRSHSDRASGLKHI
jgi:hypothetical protein